MTHAFLVNYCDMNTIEGGSSIFETLANPQFLEIWLDAPIYKIEALLVKLEKQARYDGAVDPETIASWRYAEDSNEDNRVWHLVDADDNIFATVMIRKIGVS